MAEEVLSQNEIDSLLSALSTGEMDAEKLKQEEQEKKVRVYDFKRALRFSKDQIRSLSRIHENFSRLLTTYFSAQLRTYVDIEVASVDQLPYEEFIRSIPTMTILNVFHVPPLEGRILMEANPNVAYAMMDRVLGGKGSSVNKVDNLTEIETTIMSHLFEHALENYQEAWGSIVDMEPELEDFEVNPQFLQLVSPNETVVVVSLETTVGSTSGMINICIPHVVLEPIIPKLSVHYWMQKEQPKERDPVEQEALTQTIRGTELDIRAVLGEASMSIEQFLDLKAEDVIRLDQPIGKPLMLRVDEEDKFYIQPGKLNNKLAVQILEECQGGAGHYDG
ncbi:flagellar motor switch protein FliM [Halobacillus sp. ACCC02827]|uniref:flagellar motor switch protein FliM n=1 Tax=Bacillaceae TaxID=186817 RepID=UPI0002A51F0D|nr:MULTISPECIES: flagellar motor switch protein FliM [Bacillaceae]ELK44750.1 flagellar motor switch protein FliM [Halobacillus sp. BAB-2008]QHT46665.1 flagellar motor switch protein FliM [Bacillus sp. SB49]WJE17476.1 flagellar motor switch protein FliM [Halobacillus sp. ACCC02827]